MNQWSEYLFTVLQDCNALYGARRRTKLQDGMLHFVSDP